MKKLLLFISCLCAFNSVRAQDIIDDGSPVLFVNSDRTQILRIETDETAPKVLIQSTPLIKMSHLSILASTRNGKSLLIAGVFHFNDINDNAPDSVQGFIKLDSPFTFVGVNNIPSDSLGRNRILYKIPFVLEEPGFIDVRKPLPLGALSPNEQDWYGHWAKNGAAPNAFEFYHGKFTGSGMTIDVGTLPDNDERLPSHEYHMSNLVPTEDGKLLCVVMDRLTQEEDLLRARLWRWTPGQQPQITDMNSIRSERNNWHMDSSFICLLREVPGQDNPTAEIGLMPNDVGDIIFYNFRYDESSVNLQKNGREISRSVLPVEKFFFTGITGNPNGPGDDKETQSTNQRHVNGGDMMFSRTGDSVVFITSNALTTAGAADWYASPENSAVYIYNIAEQWPSAKLVYNNPAKMERQPIFMGKQWKIAVPPPPGTINVDKTSLNFGELFLKDNPSTKTMDVVITNPAANEASVTSIAISGTGELDYSVTGTTPPMTTPFPLTEGQNVTVHVVFNPSVLGTRNATLTILFANGDSSRTVSLTGVGKADTTSGGAVDPEDLAGFNVSVHPNPFSGAANIDISYDRREGLEVRLVDVLGREYQIDADGVRAQMLSKDASEQFRLDSKALKLAPGSYTLFVKNGDRSISRQLIVSE